MGLEEQVKILRRLTGGFQASRVLIAANNLGVFDNLKTPKDAETLATAIGTDKRATALLLNALVALGLLRKKKSSFLNTPLSNAFLVKGAPYYQGDIIRHYDMLSRRWASLDEVLKTGTPLPRGGRDIRAFIMGMHNLASLRVDRVLKSIGLEGVRDALDLGGGPGTYSIGMAKKSISVTLFDMPETLEIAREIIEKEKVGARLKGSPRLKAGNFLTDDIGSGYDLILISQIFHAYTEEDNLKALEKCRKALNPEGRVVIQEFYIGEDGTRPPESALFSLNMLIGTDGGRCYSPKELKDWLRQTGFTKIKETKLDETVLVEGSTGH